LLADVSLGVSVAATVTAGILYFVRPSATIRPANERKAGTKSRSKRPERWSASVDWEPAGGAWMRVTGAF
jgi:hypothetical protein